MVSYRLLPYDDWETLSPLFEAQGGKVPARNYGNLIAVAEEQGEVVGFLAMQLVPHMEPLWIRPEYRGRVNWPHLLRLLETTLSPGEYFAFATDERISALAEAVGMECLGWKVYRATVKETESCHS